MNIHYNASDKTIKSFLKNFSRKTLILVKYYFPLLHKIIGHLVDYCTIYQ